MQPVPYLSSPPALRALSACRTFSYIIILKLHTYIIVKTVPVDKSVDLICQSNKLIERLIQAMTVTNVVAAVSKIKIFIYL